MMEIKAMNSTNRIEGAKIPHTGHRLAVTLWKKRRQRAVMLIKNEYTSLVAICSVTRYVVLWVSSGAAAIPKRYTMVIESASVPIIEQTIFTHWT